MINILCDNSLLNGYSSNKKLVDKKEVIEAAKDLYVGIGYRRIWFFFFLGIVIAGGFLVSVLLQENAFLYPFTQKIFQSLQTLAAFVQKGVQHFGYLLPNGW